jgi:ribose/xylose/arabinose/galactoside ABC-type transport system permease subunit
MNDRDRAPPGPSAAVLPRTLPGRFRPSGPMLGLLAILALFILIVWGRGNLDSFLSWPNIQGLMHQNAIAAVIALGMLVVIISGGIDLSVGSVVALVTVVTMKVFNALTTNAGLVPASLAAVAAGVAVGGLCGLVNGTAITQLRVSPFVATLGMMSMARGVAFWLADRASISFRGGVAPGWVKALMVSDVKGWQLFDPSVWSVFALAVFVAVLLRFTVFGRYCYAIGASETTARYCGIAIERNKVAVYTLAGLLTGWAGVLTFANGNSGDPGSSVGLELEVIAAVVIGGAGLSGGQGNVTGTLLGVLILGVLDNGVNFSGVPIEVKYILIGGIIVVNTALSQWQRRKSE